MKRTLVTFGLLVIGAACAFAQVADPAKIKAKIAADAALAKAKADLLTQTKAVASAKVKADLMMQIKKDDRAKIEAKIASQVQVIKTKIAEASLKAKVDFLMQSKMAQLVSLGSIVKNAPYSAEAVTETNQVLADGTRIRQSHSYKMYRDSQGRMRRESESGLEIWIVDPVANVGYVLDVKEQRARTVPLAVALAGAKERAYVRIRAAGSEEIISFFPVGKQKSGELQAKGEPLGRQIIEGVEADGNRTTETIPAGAIGNDRPIEIVSESWYSPELQLQVKSRHYDPRTGETTFRLAGIRRDEPAPDLFKVPAGYQIVTAKQE